MTLLFCDSFDHYATANIAQKYPIHTIRAAADGPSIDTGRFGSAMRFTYSNVTPAASESQRVLISGLSDDNIVMGFAYYWTTQTENDEPVISLYEGTTLQIAIRQNSLNQLYITRGVTAIATSSVTPSVNTWYYVELKVFIDAAGTVELRMNEAVVASFSGNTQNGGTGNVTTLQLGPAPSVAVANTLDYRIDDLYLCDGAGSQDYLGDIRVQTLLPNANGNSSQLVGSDGNSTDNYLLVDEAALSTADYVQSSTGGDKDTYNFGSLTTTVGDVYGVQLVPHAAKMDAGARSFASVARHSSTEEDSASRTLSLTTVYYPDMRVTKPGGGGWSISDVNAAEFGWKVSV